MNSHVENTKRIAKNTLMLYVRMLFSMLVSLYTSRVVLNTLGVEDYGINNVIAGVVSMFSLLSSSLSTAISRFITYGLGKGDMQTLKKIFSSSINVMLGLATLIIILTEIVGTWFLNYEMNIPTERMDAANWVLQCAIFAFAVGLITVPYSATVLAHEKMDVYAYISMTEICLRLVVV